MTPLEILSLVLQFLVLPVIGWAYAFQQKVHGLEAKTQVLEAQAQARETARAEDRDTTRRQLEQILAMLQTLSGRIDTLMRTEK